MEEAAGGSITYTDLNELSDRVRDRLRWLGVRKGDRVGVYLRKSIDAYAVMLGAMKAGAVYVPVDFAAPPWRSAFISNDCAVKLVVLEASVTSKWRADSTTR